MAIGRQPNISIRRGSKRAFEEDSHVKRSLVGVLAAAVVLSTALSGARAFDESKYPDIEGQWKRGSPVGSWDPRQAAGARTAGTVDA